MIKITNIDLNSVNLFLKEAKLSGQVSRFRTRLIKKIDAKVYEIGEEERSIIVDNGAEVKDNGQISGNGSKETFEKISKELTELRQERSIFEEDTEGQFYKLYAELCNYSELIAGEAADGYDKLMDSFEEGGYNEPHT
ncbi:hypothetical protein [Convivina intestini]|uniref:hypothetical protein n=1 Tax=Convivina intestini TaxID=1505726 RepID=UPI00200CF976|nr:hypothetical protein [Convivina intestini]CAH1853688.1 hypothetical protein R078131_00817 [Convivina intestini]